MNALSGLSILWRGAEVVSLLPNSPLRYLATAPPFLLALTSLQYQFRVYREANHERQAQSQRKSLMPFLSLDLEDDPANMQQDAPSCEYASAYRSYRGSQPFCRR